MKKTMAMGRTSVRDVRQVAVRLGDGLLQFAMVAEVLDTYQNIFGRGGEEFGDLVAIVEGNNEDAEPKNRFEGQTPAIGQAVTKRRPFLLARCLCQAGGYFMLTAEFRRPNRAVHCHLHYGQLIAKIMPAKKT
ncbi:MAG TPA: hypothetical protein VK742_06205 [Candidatus Sulfotelmatobacter sp.]|nr:hypothetical protein [Candidatus Sulfotelmatobacter sp.]